MLTLLLASASGAFRSTGGEQEPLRGPDRGPSGTVHGDRTVGTANPDLSRRLTSVAVMESANQGQFDDFTLVGCFDTTRLRAVLFQKPVRTLPMVIARVVRQNTAQMFLVENDHAVQAFPADGTDPAFDPWILPR